MLRALARVNLAAIERNCARLARDLSPGVALGTVVKADGYGHGAAQVARAALTGGASWICVVSAQEAADLRAAGIDARLLVMGAVSEEELPLALAADADLVVWREQFVDRLVARADRPVRVHVKLDTGMGRLGTRDRDEALRVAERALVEPLLELAGGMTHFATADDDLEFLAEQLARFRPFADELRRRAPGITLHAANSAATLRAPEAHFDLVRCGIATYGLDPLNADPDERELEPALELSSYVADVKPLAAGESVGYGRRFIASEPTSIATLPIGYGDGVRRALTNACDVLIGGRRHPLVGTVSMDNVTIDIGADATVKPGDEAILIGAQGEERVTAEEIARAIGTINYEVTCGISARVPRSYHRDGEAA